MSDTSNSARTGCDTLKVRVSVLLALEALESSYSRENRIATSPGSVSSAIDKFCVKVMASPGVSLCT